MTTLNAFRTGNSTPREDLEDNTTVIARCHDCDDEHALGAREPGWTTTTCPMCASTSYRTEVLDNA